jgi:hypothetical protein
MLTARPRAEKVTDTLKRIKIVLMVWYVLSMDLIGPLKKTAKQNECSHACRLFYKMDRSCTNTAITVAEALHEQVYSRNGAPHRIITDNGKEFSNAICSLD